MKTRHFLIAIYILAFAAGLALEAGCASKEEHEGLIIDRPTPPGEVPPPNPEGSAAAEPYRPYPEEAAPTGPQLDSVVSAFAAQYTAAGKPRIAVYLNRELSAEVREWVSDTRLAIEGASTQTTTKDGKTTTKTSEGNITGSVQDRADEGNRLQPAEHWAWRLEDALTQPLLDAGVKLIDRALMMRLTANEAAPSPGQAIHFKTIEMNALKGKADILVEVLISSGQDPKWGYIFRTKAMDINAGQLLVSTSSADWPPAWKPKGEWINSPEGGYERSNIINPKKVGNWIAQDLMAKLGPRLSK